jgi:hypothetical protein
MVPFTCTVSTRVSRNLSTIVLFWSMVALQSNVQVVKSFSVPSSTTTTTTRIYHRSHYNHQDRDQFRPTSRTIENQQYFTSQPSLRRSHLPLNALPHDSVWVSVVEYFDGSTIVDPVVVSNVFWSRLQANILSVLLGQFLAAIVFSFLLSIATSQVTKVVTYISEQVFSANSQGIRTQEQPLRIPRNLRSNDDTIATIQPDWSKLLLCIAIDTIGSSSILLPFIGDATDVLWAPTAGLLLRNLFYNSNVIFVFELTEEILPLTDIIPLATICWTIDTYFRESKLAQVLQLGVYATPTDSR